MSIKDLPHVTVEQVLALRKAAIDIEQQLADLKASLPKVRADAVLSAIEENKCTLNAPSYREEIEICYIDDLKEHADKLEAGNE